MKPKRPCSAIRDTFRGDNELLSQCIKALLELNDSNSLAPHGIGGHARTLLSACYHRLPDASDRRPATSDLVRCVEYLEAHGGRLTQSMCRTKWPDGTETAFAWQYAADDTGVLGAKTAMDAIRQHMKSERRQAPNGQAEPLPPDSERGRHREVVLRRLVMPTVEALNRNFATALEIRLHGEYLRGKVEGLWVAKIIRDWLTRQPDRIWQKQVREWADNEIANAERELA